MEPKLPSGSIEFQPPWALDTIVRYQLGTLEYLLYPQAAPAENLRTFADNASIWQTILAERVRAEMTVKLERFYLLEWFPRAPGLYYTEDALRARREALHHIDPRFGSRGSAEHTAVLLPRGKSSMLAGGVGCIRLKPIVLGEQIFWLMTATSSGIAHEGFPLAVPHHLYERHIDQLAEQGAVPCTIVGRLKFLPAPLTHLLDHYRAVPRLYLQVDDIRAGRGVSYETGVSVAVSFVSSFAGSPAVYAAYSIFDAAKRGSFERSMDWLKHTYVEQLYGGRILTDFDQTQTHFPEAALSLRKIMGHRLQKDDIREVIELMHAAGRSAELLERVDLRELAKTDGAVARTRVFISYSHQDSAWLERLRVFLKPLTREGNVDVWDDTRLASGSEWEPELDSAIESARVAILLITADFVASDYIRDRELPKLLSAAEESHLTLLPLFVGASTASEDPRLTKFQAVNDPRRPLKALPENDRDLVFQKVLEEVRRILGVA